VEHAVVTFARDVGFHFHGDMPGQYRQKQPLLFISDTFNDGRTRQNEVKLNLFPPYLLLINFLRSQSRLDALSGFQKRLSLRHFVGIMHHDTGHVCARQQE